MSKTTEMDVDDQIMEEVETTSSRADSKKVRKSSIICSEDILPVEIRRIIFLTYVADIPSYIAFAQCSKKCYDMIYNKSPFLWRSLKFSTVPGATENLTDELLSAFLTRIHAKENTTLLSLLHCSRIKGYGIKPLEGSKKLRKIDLRVIDGALPEDKAGPTGLNNEYVLNVLLTMTPAEKRTRSWNSYRIKHPIEQSFSLEDVRFRLQRRLDDGYIFDPKILGFLQALNGMINQKANGIKCDYCKNDLGEDHCISDMRCSDCMKLCCEQCCDGGEFRDTCCVCQYSYCQDCNQLEYCNMCQDYYCRECMQISACTDCESKICQGCLEYCVCGQCGEIICSSCNPDGAFTCAECCKLFCSHHCHDTALCGSCDGKFCDECFSSSSPRCSFCTYSCDCFE